MIPIYTSVRGNNADLFKQVSEFYIPDGAVVADVTYGKGAFWKKTDISRFDLVKSDLYTLQTRAYDYCDLPYESECFDVLVFDPPYVHTPGEKFQKNHMYANRKSVGKETEKYHKAVTQRYRMGMAEGYRCIKQGGQMWVKCQDEICSGYQWWTHFEVYQIARVLGMYAKDMFVLTQKTNPTIQHKRQQHARKNHSYLFIFNKPTTKQRRDIFKHGIP